MALTDWLSDMLTRIRNGQKAHHAKIEVPFSGLLKAVCDVLVREGYIRAYTEQEQRPGVRALMIELKYHEGAPAIKEIVRVSRPGRRVYTRIEKLERVYNGLGISILSTPKGVLSDNEARAENVGGEVLCQVF